MHKLDYIRRQPWIGDFNTLVDTVNQIIDRLNRKIEIEEVVISKEVKDFKFFNWEETSLPYHAVHTLSNTEDASKIFKLYALTYKEMNNITGSIEKGNIVSLVVDVTEEVTEKEKKQEAIFETIETMPTKKKGGRKKKNSWK